MKLFVAALVLGSAACASCASGSAGTTSQPPVIVPTQPPQPGDAPRSSPVATPAPAEPPSFRCDAGKRFEIGARSYCAYADEDTWEASERRCIANGGHLVTIDDAVTSEKIHAALGSPLRAGRAAWIGLEKTKGPKREWRWIDGRAVDAPSWNTGEPNDFGGNEACGEWLVANGKWNDTRCELRQPYVCQAKPDKPLSLTCRGAAFTVGSFSYCYNTTERSWAEAKRACATDGGSLATFASGGDDTGARNALGARFTATKFWIGLTDEAEESQWTWTSGAPSNFEAWAPGEPNDFQQENCVELHADTWTWNDLACGEHRASVCESTPKTR